MSNRLYSEVFLETRNEMLLYDKLENNTDFLLNDCICLINFLYWLYFCIFFIILSTRKTNRKDRRNKIGSYQIL